jgi:ketosteroid isomerase-like protein
VVLSLWDKNLMRAQQLLINCCLICLPMLSMAQQNPQDAPRILELEKKWTDAYKQRDINTMTSLLAEDVVVTVEDGRSFGRIGYMSHTADSGVQVDLAEESDVKVRMHGNVAVVTGMYHETGNSKGKRYEYHDRFTDIWMKTSGQWQLIAAQYGVPVQQ